MVRILVSDFHPTITGLSNFSCSGMLFLAFAALARFTIATDNLFCFVFFAMLSKSLAVHCVRQSLFAQI
jgi:hypothetical protein